MRQYLINNYEPAKDYVSASVKLSTVQLHHLLFGMYPDADMSVSDLYVFLKDQGYEEVEVRPFTTEFIFDKKK